MILCPRCEGKGSVPNPADCGLTTIRCTWYDELWEDRRLSIPEDIEPLTPEETADATDYLTQRLVELLSKPIGGAHGEDQK